MLAFGLIFVITQLPFATAEAQTLRTTQVQPYPITTSDRPVPLHVARITSRPALELRDVNSVCGYWSSVGITYTVQCDDGIPCIFSSIAPGSIFGYCTHSGVQVITTGYDYYSWPTGGCQPGQLCCNSGLPYYGEYLFNNGASSFFDCGSSRFLQTAVTAIAASTASSSTTSMTSPTSSSSSSPTSTASPGSVTSSSNPTSTSTNTLNGSDQPATSSSKLSVGAIVGIVIGAIGVIVLLGIAVFCCLRRRRQNTPEDVFLQMHPSTDGEAPPYHQNPRYYDDPVYHTGAHKSN